MLQTDLLLEKPILTMTGAEFLEIMKMSQNTQPQILEKEDFTGNEFVFGLSGLARFLGCGRTKAAEIRASGKIDIATYQVGSKLMFNKNKVLECLK